MQNSSRMRDKLGIVLFVIVGVASIDFHELQVDEISGELIKPANWSDVKFITVQQLRLSVRKSCQNENIAMFLAL